MTTTDKTRFMMVHGGWGVGKTWLVHSMPGHRIVFDTEGGFEDVQVPVVLWDPLNEPIPEIKHENTSVVVDVTHLDQVKEGVRILKTGDHPFTSFGLDSFTESQKQLKTEVSDTEGEYDPNAVFDHQAWGRLLNNGELIVRDMRNLTRPSAARRMHGLVVMGSDMEAAPIRPLLQGAMRKHMAGFFRLEGYLYQTVGKEGGEFEGQVIRVMNINPAHAAEAKCNMHLVNEKYRDAGAGYQILNPNMADIIAVANA